MVVLTGAPIAFRLAANALVWSEEATRYLMIWATLLGASCVYKRMGHISVTVLQAAFPRWMRTAMQVACHVLCAAFFLLGLFVSTLGIALVQEVLAESRSRDMERKFRAKTAYDRVVNMSMDPNTAMSEEENAARGGSPEGA